MKSDRARSGETSRQHGLRCNVRRQARTVMYRDLGKAPATGCDNGVGGNSSVSLSRKSPGRRLAKHSQ